MRTSSDGTPHRQDRASKCSTLLLPALTVGHRDTAPPPPSPPPSPRPIYHPFFYSCSALHPSYVPCRPLGSFQRDAYSSGTFTYRLWRAGFVFEVLTWTCVV